MYGKWAFIVGKLVILQPFKTEYYYLNHKE